MLFAMLRWPEVFVAATRQRNVSVAAGRWDLVVEACAKCLSSVKKCDPKFVVSIGVKDAFPFRWMFPAKGFETMTPPQLRLLAKTRGDLFAMLRHALSALVPKMTKQEYERRLKEIAGKYGRPLQQSASILERARVAYADNADTEMHLARFNPDLVPIGPEIAVNTTKTGTQNMSGLGRLGDGTTVVARTSCPEVPSQPETGQDGAACGIYAQRFDRNGNKVGGEVQVNTTEAGSQVFPSVGVMPDDRYIIVWTVYEAFTPVYVPTGIYGQRYLPNGTPLGGEVRLNAKYNDGGLANISTHANGTFAIVWPFNHGRVFQKFDRVGVDFDGDGILDDGDQSGLVNDHVCQPSETVECDDRGP